MPAWMWERRLQAVARANACVPAVSGGVHAARPQMPGDAGAPTTAFETPHLMPASSVGETVSKPSSNKLIINVLRAFDAVTASKPSFNKLIINVLRTFDAVTAWKPSPPGAFETGHLRSASNVGETASKPSSNKLTFNILQAFDAATAWKPSPPGATEGLRRRGRRCRPRS